MRRGGIITCLAMAILAQPWAAVAQETGGSPPSAPPPAVTAPPAAPPEAPPPAAIDDTRKEVFLTGETAELTLAKTSFIGRTVFAEDGAEIGGIDDLVLEADRVVAVIVGVGGFLGVGERKIGVRYGALRFIVRDNVLKIVLPGTTKEELARVAPFALTAPQKNILQKAGEVAKDAARKAGDVAKAGIEKAKEAVQGTTAPAEPGESAPPAAPAKP